MVVGPVVVWHGDQALVLELLTAIEHHCTCRGMSGSCPTHLTLLDQRALDRLLFARWLRERLLAEEQLAAYDP